MVISHLNGKQRQTGGSRMNEKKIEEFLRKCPYCGTVISGDYERFNDHKRNCPKKSR
jgi:hypothetical protein